MPPCHQQANVNISGNAWETHEGETILSGVTSTAVLLENMPQATILNNTARTTDAAASIDIRFTADPAELGVPDFNVRYDISSNAARVDGACPSRRLSFTAANAFDDPIPVAGLIAGRENACYTVVRNTGFDNSRQCASLDAGTVEYELCNPVTTTEFDSEGTTEAADGSATGTSTDQASSLYDAFMCPAATSDMSTDLRASTTNVTKHALLTKEQWKIAGPLLVFGTFVTWETVIGVAYAVTKHGLPAALNGFAFIHWYRHRGRANLLDQEKGGDINLHENQHIEVKD